MIICSTEDASLLNTIDNTYLRTKKELDNFIHKTRTVTNIEVMPDFIEKEFINQGIDFEMYIKTIGEVNGLIQFNQEYSLDSKVESTKKALMKLRTPRELALYILNNRTFIQDLKFTLNELDELKSEVDHLKSNVMLTRKELERTKEAIRKVDKENNNLHSDVISLSSRIRQIKELNKKIHIDKYEYVIYIKENESVRHTFSLVSAIRNKLTTQGLSTSIMTIVPKSSDLIFEKWKLREFVDLRSSYVTELVDSRKVVVDYSIQNKIEVFLRNTVGSNVLIILDKSLSSQFIFSANKIFLVDVGRFKIQKFNHFGTIKNINTTQYTLQELTDFYCSNPVIDSIVKEISNGSV